MRHLLVALGLAALAACSSGEPESGDAATGDAPPAEAPPSAASAPPSPTTTAAASSIPAAMQGRWGLVPNDCQPGRADAKGLLVVGADTLEYYESMGTLAQVEERSANRLLATFDFTGEGMTWQREMEFVEDRGTLTVREFGEDAMPIPLGYDRCA